MNASISAIVPSDPTASGVALAIVLAAGVVALVGVAVLALVLQRRQRLTVSRGIASVATAIGVALIALIGILLLAPAAAQATDGASHPSIHLALRGSEV